MASYFLRSSSKEMNQSIVKRDLGVESELLAATEESQTENISIASVFESPSRDAKNSNITLLKSPTDSSSPSLQRNHNISPAELQTLIDTAVEERMSELNKQKSNVPILPSVDTNAIMREMFAMNNEFLKTMTESFLKLSDKLTDNLKAPTKEQNFSKVQDFPKFDGTNFSDWCRLMKCQLACDPWTEIYDFGKQIWKDSTDNTLLDNHLYKQVMRCLGSSVLAFISSREDITGKGLLLLKVLQSNYATRANRHYLNNLMQQFRNMCRKDDETVDVYFARFMAHVTETNRVAVIIDGQTSIAQASARNHFILTLGKHFENTIKQYDEGHKKYWDHITWDELLDEASIVLCKYQAEHHSKGGGTKKGTENNDKTKEELEKEKEERTKWREKVCKLIETSSTLSSPALLRMQKECPGCCVYHKSKSHKTEECAEIRKIQNRVKEITESIKANHSLGQFDANVPLDPLPTDESSNRDNDTNAAVTPYSIKAHCTYKNNGVSRTHTDSMIADSGANFHMFNDKRFFKNLKKTYQTSRVLLPDGASIPIEGIGMAYCITEDGVKFELDGVLYVPKLQKSLFSLLTHLKKRNHSVEKVDNKTMKLIFPTFRTFIEMDDEMYVHLSPSLIQPSANSVKVKNITTVQRVEGPHHTNVERSNQAISVAENTSEDPQSIQDELKNESVSKSPYHFEVIELNPFDDSESPRHFNTIEVVQNIEIHQTHDQPLPSYVDEPLRSDERDPSHLLPQANQVVSANQSSSSSLVTISTQSNVPILRPVDKVSSTLPASVTFNRDELHSCLGFRNIDNLVKVLDTHYQPTIRLTATPNDPVMDLGDVATMHKKNRNTEPINRPETFGQVVHVDIAFGPDVGIGNVHYALILVDRYSRFTYTYPLVNLNSDIVRAFKQFYADIGIVPKRIIGDFDHKLIGSDAKEFLTENMTHVNAAPPGRQSQNGLVERHWQTITAMSRNWLSSAQLPPSFWYMAIKRAAEITNYLPVKVDENHLTPLELAYGVKPDLRNLFPMFSLAYVKKDRDSNRFRNKFESMSEMMITVGKCSVSDGLLFYNPKTKTIVSSADYKLDTTTTSGPKFGMEYRPGNWIHKLDESTSLRTPIFKLESTVLVHTHDPPHVAQVIDLPSVLRPNIYTVRHRDGSIVDYKSEDLELAPETNEHKMDVLPSWVKEGANCTLFLEDMDAPKHGKLYQLNGQWEFLPGTSSKNDPITLKDLVANANDLLSSAQMFKGHTKFPMVLAAKEKYIQEKDLQNVIARHVSASGLESLVPPSSLKRLGENYSEGDKKIWLDAYKEEYDGLTSIPTWQVITESDFRSIKHLCPKPLPSMAISTIKFDENGKPKRAKYRIVVLGNIDTNRWENSQTSAPVMKHSELRLLVSIAISQQRMMKNGDVKQAFVLSKLPPTETYIVRPPSDCPLSTPNTYWRLIQSLYGLKRAPKIWYEKMSKILTDIGLTSCPSAPCVFFGRIIPDLPPLYLGLYVDDFIYFSQSDEVEKEFEKRLAAQLDGKVEFLGQVSQFLGVEFTWEGQGDKLTVTLSQQAFIETLVETWNLQNSSVKCINSPYRSGIPIDAIPTMDLSEAEMSTLRQKYQSITGSLNWLATTTRPDISTCVSLLAQYQANPSPGHLEAALYCVKYLHNTSKLGIRFTTSKRTPLEAFLQFPVKENLPMSMSDSNWGPLDASNKPVPVGQAPKELELFKSRSVSGFYVDLNGPLHWTSKRQGKTAVSSAEAEIYAANECTKYLLELEQIMFFLECKDMFMPNANIVYVDNSACVDWSKNTTTKGLRHIQMRENHVRENIQDRFLEIRKIDGKLNLADLFTKEHKDVSHFTLIRDMMMHSKPTTSHHSAQSESSEGGVGGFS